MLFLILTVKRVQRFAVSDDRQRVVVVELVVELVGVGGWLSGLGRTGAAMRSVMLLIGVVCVAALRADGKQAAEVNLCVHEHEPAINDSSEEDFFCILVRMLGVK